VGDVESGKEEAVVGGGFKGTRRGRGDGKEEKQKGQAKGKRRGEEG